MNYTGVFKRQTTIILLSILLIAILLIGASMAMFTDTKKSETQTLTAGTLSATFTGSTTLTTDLIPMSDDDALKESNNKFTLTLTNTGTLPMNYTITIFNKSGVANPLAHKYLKIQYDSEPAKYLTQFSKVDSSKTEENQIQYVLKSSSIAAGTGGLSKTETHTIRVWIAETASDNTETDTDIIGKDIELSIGLSGSVQE